VCRHYRTPIGAAAGGDAQNVKEAVEAAGFDPRSHRLDICGMTAAVSRLGIKADAEGGMNGAGR
jgi:hypothetical protein